MFMNSAAETAAAGHAGRMDRMYRLQRHIYDATRAYYLLGRNRLLDELAPPPGGSILEIGCGTGRNLAGAGRRYPGAKLFGLDISEAMLQTAAASLSRAGIMPRVKLAQADATRFDAAACFGQQQFDRVFVSYALSMIPDWRGALKQAWEVTAPGGSLHIVDFGGCEKLPHGVRRILFAWLAKFHVTPRLEAAKALSEIAGKGPSQPKVATPFGHYCIVIQLKKIE
jgi:S-adenosylmethionine-diacylgycerolhomoserine-N-methlytransferase